MILVFLGKPGSGKGTQATLLSKKLKIPAISMGELLRKIEKENSPLGKFVKKRIDKGLLMPDEITFKILKKRLQRKDCRKGFIIDGFPRTVSQAEMLEKIKKVDKVIYIDVPDKVIVKRLSSRRECSCGAVYNMITNPPKNDEICDVCGKKLYIRNDDKPETVKKRLNVYNKQTKPLIDFYKKKKLLAKVNGNQEIKKIFKDIMKILKE